MVAGAGHRSVDRLGRRRRLDCAGASSPPPPQSKHCGDHHPHAATHGGTVASPAVAPAIGGIQPLRRLHRHGLRDLSSSRCAAARRSCERAYDRHRPARVVLRRVRPPRADQREEVLNSCGAVYICTWTSEHPRLVEAAGTQGSRSSARKPLATGAAARHMFDVVNGRVTNQVGLVLRRSPALPLAAPRDPARRKRGRSWADLSRRAVHPDQGTTRRRRGGGRNRCGHAAQVLGATSTCSSSSSHRHGLSGRRRSRHHGHRGCDGGLVQLRRVRSARSRRSGDVFVRHAAAASGVLRASLGVLGRRQFGPVRGPTDGTEEPPAGDELARRCSRSSTAPRP